MNKAKLEALLGRSLRASEEKTYTKDIEFALAQLELWLCSSLYVDSDKRYFTTRKDMRTVFTDMFRDITSVSVDGEVVPESDYYKAFWSNRNGQFFNSIIFKKAYSKELDVVIDADWGLDCLPGDLSQVFLALYTLATKKKSVAPRIKSKKVEDFSVTYGDETALETIRGDFADIIGKYSICNVGSVSSGSVAYVPLSKRANRGYRGC